MEARPKSPLQAEDLQQIFDHLPSGMVQVCMCIILWAVIIIVIDSTVLVQFQEILDEI